MLTGGVEVVRSIAYVPVGAGHRPVDAVVVTECGELNVMTTDNNGTPPITTDTNGTPPITTDTNGTPPITTDTNGTPPKSDDPSSVDDTNSCPPCWISPPLFYIMGLNVAF